MYMCVYSPTHFPQNCFQLNQKNVKKFCLSSTYRLSIGFIKRAFLLDLGQLHVHLFADHSHGVPSWKRLNGYIQHTPGKENKNLKAKILLLKFKIL